MFSAATKTGSQPSVAANYIEDVFSTYLYTGNGSTQTITNGIDLAGEGGLVWIKNRGVAENNLLEDTIRGATKRLSSDSTGAQSTVPATITSFNSNGFSLGTDPICNGSGNTYVSWTFRKAPKFFDVVTYTGDGTAGKTVAHNLGSAPGMIIVKITNTTGSWQVYHRGANATTPENYYLQLNSTAAAASGISRWNNTAPTSTNFTLGDSPTVNGSGNTYVAYLFAHDAGGFGLSGTDNVISCGSYTGNGSTSGPVINLGYEPQYVMFKKTSSTGNWWIQDTMRGFTANVAGATDYNQTLVANTADAEGPSQYMSPTATGFQVVSSSSTPNQSGATYIYMAIRRGPMKVPTTGTEVFSPRAESTNTARNIQCGFVADLFISRNRGGPFYSYFYDRLRGGDLNIYTPSVSAEITYTMGNFATQNGVNITTIDNYLNSSNQIDWFFRRAPNFFDEVCYTGTGSATTQAHNLGVAPELMIVKSRSLAGTYWNVYTAPLGNTKVLFMNQTSASSNYPDGWNNTSPTSSVFTVGTESDVNGSGYTYVAYLFATCAGVSKVGSYTGNGSTQAIACGFTGGARFVLIKRTDSTGDWYVYDTARGMTTLVDPYLLLNTTAAESATLGSVTTTTGGFTVNASILAAINTNGASYIFLAIA